MSNPTDRQLLLDRLAGILLVLATSLALIVANSPLELAYSDFLHWKLGPVLPQVGQMDVHLWVADGLMAIFFLLVGLEVKREWYEGRLATREARRLPVIAAVAGMAVPAMVYLAVTGLDPSLIRGWAIPAATDIAFAIGILAVLGRHAPSSVKLLLVTIAIVDDIGAVLVIALAYTESLNPLALGGAATVTALLVGINRLGVRRLWPYLLGFGVLWYLVLASGIHPTIAGILAAFTIPLGRREKKSPLIRLEHMLHPWVMFAITPLFALASAGVHLSGGLAAIAQPLPLGILLGLFLGKQLGVFGAIRIASATGVGKLPPGLSWMHVYGAAVLCGIGFTMSLFIGGLAFPDDKALVDAAKVGTLAGSLLSALVGWCVFRLLPPIADEAADRDAQALFGSDEADRSD